MALADDILAGIDSGTLDNIAQQLGLEPGKVQEVLKDSLPALLGGLDKNVQSGDGAASLANALGDHAEANPLGDLGCTDQRRGSAAASSRRCSAARRPTCPRPSAARPASSGVDVEKILKIAAPIVMAFLAIARRRAAARPTPRSSRARSQKANSAAKSDAPDLGSILGGLLGGAK